jgi:8-oxo-dGTP diphosphatase
MPQTAPVVPVAAVSVACWRGDAVLLVRRGRPPLEGVWSLPGGRIEPGEAARAAALRELAEETGLQAEIVGVVDVVDQIARGAEGTLERHFVIAVFAAVSETGEAIAGDDAAAVKWVGEEELAMLATTPRLANVVAASRRVVAAVTPRDRPPAP